MFSQFPPTLLTSNIALPQKPQRCTKSTKVLYKSFALFVLLCGLAKSKQTFEARLPNIYIRFLKDLGVTRAKR